MRVKKKKELENAKKHNQKQSRKDNGNLYLILIKFNF